jgi:methylated-DNA-[protein]-cysteine S-methyltransferase
MLEWTEATIAEGLAWRITAGASGLRAVEFCLDRPPAGRRCDANPLLIEATRQLRAYFAGELREFRLPLELVGTDFRKRVWSQVLTIAYGETRSYSQIAAALGAPKAVRAVGAANGANSLPIVIPCHRVIGSGGKLVGYGGGLPLKKRLLDLEGWQPGAHRDNNGIRPRPSLWG